MKERKLGNRAAQPRGNAQWAWWSQQLQDNGNRLGLFLLDVNNQLNVWDLIMFPPRLLPPFFSTGNFPKEKQLSFSLSKVDYHNNFLFHLGAGFFWKSLMASSERGYCLAVTWLTCSWVVLGIMKPGAVFAGIYEWARVPSPLTGCMWRLEAFLPQLSSRQKAEFELGIAFTDRK